MQSGVTNSSTLDEIGSEVFERATRTNRDLRLIKGIEQEVSRLCIQTKFFGTLLDMVQTTSDNVKRYNADHLIDPSRTSQQNLLSAQTAVRELRDTMIERKRVWQRADGVTEEDGIIEEYARAIAVVSDLHNAVNELRWTLSAKDGRNAARTDRDGKTYSSSTEIEAFLRSI